MFVYNIPKYENSAKRRSIICGVLIGSYVSTRMTFVATAHDDLYVSTSVSIIVSREKRERGN